MQRRGGRGNGAYADEEAPGEEEDAFAIAGRAAPSPPRHSGEATTVRVIPHAEAAPPLAPPPTAGYHTAAPWQPEHARQPVFGYAPGDQRPRSPWARFVFPLWDNPVSHVIRKHDNAWPGAGRAWGWLRGRDGRRFLGKWCRSMFIRAAALAAVCLLLYVWVLPAVLGSGGTGRFPSYVDGLDREIENAIRHEESGRPWESYDERQARWIRERATFSAIDEADHHPRGYKEVEWHDGVRRNVSLDRLWRAMRHITLDPVCVCAAHLLVPLNVVRLPDEGRTVVFDPLIITAAGKPMERCFRDPLFGYDHDGGHQGAAEPEAEAAAPGHCEAFPEQLFVEYHTGFGGGARGTSRRTWFNDNASVMCIVHCSSIATRSVVYNGEGGLLAGYATKLYAQRRNRGGGGGPK